MELRIMDPRTRKSMPMHKALHPKEGERGLASIEKCVNSATKDLEEHINQNKERLITFIGKNTKNT